MFELINKTNSKNIFQQIKHLNYPEDLFKIIIDLLNMKFNCTKLPVLNRYNFCAI